MSAIQKELAAATEVEPSKRKDETIVSQDYMKRLAVSVGELDEAAWKALSVEAKNWYNEAADAITAKKDTTDRWFDVRDTIVTGRSFGSSTMLNVTRALLSL